MKKARTGQLNKASNFATHNDVIEESEISSVSSSINSSQYNNEYNIELVQQNSNLSKNIKYINKIK